jgi:hypothetical protein
MPIPKFTVETLANFVEVVAEIRKDWSEPEWVEPWYRGQLGAEWPLLPRSLLGRRSRLGTRSLLAQPALPQERLNLFAPLGRVRLVPS